MNNMELQTSQVYSAISQAEDTFTKVASAYGKLAFKSEAEFARQLISASSLVKEDKLRFALISCTPDSIYNAVAQVSTIGLSLNPKLGHAYLIPRFNSQSGKLECSLDFGYKGLIKLGIEAKAITHVGVDSIFSWDIEEGKFNWNGPTTEPDFSGINPFDSRRETIMSAGVICVSHLVGGGVQVTRMSRLELDKIRADSFSPAYKFWREQMEFRSVIKRAAKLWPMTSIDDRIQNAVDLLNGADAKYGDAQALQAEPQQPAAKIIKSNPLDILTKQLGQLHH